MSKISKEVAKIHAKNIEDKKLHKSEVVTNFMGGDSYVMDPLTTLKMISASSIFGEPSYYRDSNRSNSYLRKYSTDSLLAGYSIIPKSFDNKSTDQIMEETIDKALDYDFDGVLNWAIECRKTYLMRLNPQVIMVRAAIHPKRKEYSESHPGKFDKMNQIVMSRADEPLTQMAYYMYINNGEKNKIPSIIKRSWAKKISNLTPYQVNKYKNSEIGMINGVRICHANSTTIDELMRTGSVSIDEDEKTWENMRSSGSDWKTIFHTIEMGHMSLLRNLRGIFTEVNDSEFCNEVLNKLKSGVKTGKQFPFRYYSAIKAIENDYNVNHRPMIIDALEECMDISIENMPKLKGRTMCLSDNSGSAWGAITTEYGSTKIAEIDNLSAVIMAVCSDEGYVGKFGDRLKVYPISKRRGILSQANEISSTEGNDVGYSTEGGIWEFFKNAIDSNEHWDNIVIFSDQQAGTGGLYGDHMQHIQYSTRGYSIGQHINVFKLILDYRDRVYSKVNVLSVQTAGYDNAVIPQQAYRTDLTYGWTGKEAIYFDAKIRLWDKLENSSKNNQNL